MKRNARSRRSRSPKQPAPALPAARPGQVAAEANARASRRRFLQLLAGGAAAPWARAALPALGLVSATSTAAQTPTAAEQPPEVEPWLAIVRQRYGAHLSDAQIKAVAENLAWTARTGKTLRAAALANSDEPDVVFRAEPPETSR